MKSLIKLTKRQIATLKRHSEHHSSKHMKMMKSEMRKGKSFGQAHKKAQKQIGT
tara:strand:+ start:552 stop:713 length:162 start_codon:yes stop_codon:yes gene_type:complete